MYEFLKNLTLVDTGRLKTPASKNPTGMTLRVFSDGSVFPSKELVETFKLEYVSAQDPNVGNGIDFFDSTQWAPTATLPKMILFGITPKTESKIDLFGSCRFDVRGNPKSSVLTQGVKSEDLLALITSMGYLNEDQKYCDLEVVLQYPIKTEDGIAYIPKTINKGAKKGEKTYSRRENVSFYPVNTVENLKELRDAEALVNSTENITIPVNN